MNNSNQKPPIPSLRKIFDGYSENQIKQAEKNLIAYVEIIAEIAMQSESSNIPDGVLTQYKKDSSL